jgi:hypothetical protein
MDRQQRFLGALVNKVRSNDVLLNPVKLYPVLDAATSSLTTDPGLASLRGLYDLVRGMRNIPTERVQFLTVPRESYAYNANRDQLVEPAAEKLFERLRMDAPLEVSKELPEDSGTKRSGSEPVGNEDAYGDSHNYEPYDGSYEESGEERGAGLDQEFGQDDGKSGAKRPEDPSLTPSPAPTFRGNTAAEDACG